MALRDRFAPRVRPLPERPGDTERRGIAASAQRLVIGPSPNKVKQPIAKKQEWQEEGWGYFDDVPEIKQTTWLGGNVMAKLRLFIAVRPLDDAEGDPIPASDPQSGIPAAYVARAQAELDRLKSPEGGLPELMRALSMNLEIAAECNLVGIGPREVTINDPVLGVEIPVLIEERFDIKSIDELEVKPDGTKIVHQQPGDKGVALRPDIDSAVRIWQRHPRWSFLPDNSMRGVLSECEAVVLLTNQIKALAKSAQSAGFFTVPNELSVKPIADETVDEDGEEAKADDFLDDLTAALIDPVEDPSSAAAVAPTFIRGEAEYLQEKYLRHIVLARPADADIDARIEHRVERIARGLNYPVETVMGHQQTTFANAAQIDEDKFRDHFEPKAVLMCDSFTVGHLQPNLLDQGLDPLIVERLFVWYSPDAIIRRVDPSASAQEALAAGAISYEAYRRELGWSEDDMPTPEEQLIRSVMHLRTFDPGISTAILDLLGVPLDIPTELPGTGSGSAAPASAAPSLARALLDLYEAKHNGKALPPASAQVVRAAQTPHAVRMARARDRGRTFMDIDTNLRARLVVAADRALTRVLDRAGNVVKARANKELRAILRNTAPRYCVATLGPKLVAAAGFTNDDLISGDAWSELESQFMQWGANAQRAAINAANKIVGLSTSERSALEVRQAGDLKEAWSWMKDQLHTLATQKLYAPDPLAPNVGEFDPTSKVPTGLIRQAITRAGGANGLTVQTQGEYVVLDNGLPPGGIGTGQLVGEALTNNGGAIDGYEWVYGPAFRLHPFIEHEVLDGITFTDFEDDQLASDSDWIDGDYYYPGDHDGCNCDIAPIILSPDEAGVAFDVEGGGHFTEGND